MIYKHDFRLDANVMGGWQRLIPSGVVAAYFRGQSRVCLNYKRRVQDFYHQWQILFFRDLVGRTKIFSSGVKGFFFRGGWGQKN